MSDLDKAAEAQEKTFFDENNMLRGGQVFSSAEARMASVHARQDLVLVVSLLSVIARRSRLIMWALFSIVALLGWRFLVVGA